jgi:hypothetical protein
MSVESLVCLDCGAVWQSAAAARASALNGGCLVCGGKLAPASQADRGVDPKAGDAPTDTLSDD